MEPNSNITQNRTLTILFGLYLAAHVLLTGLQIYHEHYKPGVEKAKCSCQK